MGVRSPLTYRLLNKGVVVRIVAGLVGELEEPVGAGLDLGHNASYVVNLDILFKIVIIDSMRTFLVKALQLISITLKILLIPQHLALLWFLVLARAHVRSHRLHRPLLIKLGIRIRVQRTMLHLTGRI